MIKWIMIVMLVMWCVAMVYAPDQTLHYTKAMAVYSWEGTAHLRTRIGSLFDRGLTKIEKEAFKNDSNETKQGD